MSAYPATHYLDILWASPPCTEHSRAESTGLRIEGALDERHPHRDFAKADDNVRATRHVIAQLKPRYWFIENPYVY